MASPTKLPRAASMGFLALLLGFTACTAPAWADDAADGQAAILDQVHRQPIGTNRHPDAQWFPDAGLGLFIHWGIASAGASGDLSWGMLANKPWKDRTVTPNTYYGWIKDWHPDKVDYPTQLGLAKAAGFTYAVLVTKHHDGFTLWPSKFGDFGTKTSLGGRDFVREFTDACRQHGLKVGLYYSPPDWWFSRHYKSFAYSGGPLDMDHKPCVLPTKPADHDTKRRELVTGQVTELLTNYGRIDLLWFDGGHGEIPNSKVRDLQQGIVINRRNGASGDYGDSEGKLPQKRFTGWFETCETCWPAGKWSYTEEYGWDTAPEVLEKLIRLRAWGGNLLANVGPKGDGSVPEPALSAWRDMANWMTHHRESVIGAGPGPFPESVNAPVTTGRGCAYVHFLPHFKKTVIWTKAPEPAEARLLRDGSAVPFEWHDGTLRIPPAAGLDRTTVEVVKLTFTP